MFACDTHCKTRLKIGHIGIYNHNEFSLEIWSYVKRDIFYIIEYIDTADVVSSSVEIWHNVIVNIKWITSQYVHIVYLLLWAYEK